MNGYMKAVIFDLGNVLIDYDSEATLAAITAVSRQPKPVPPEFVHQLGIGQINGRQFHQYLVAHNTTTSDYDIFAAAACQHMQRNEAALAFALNLAKRPFLRVGVISNTNQIHADWLHQHVPELSRFHDVILSNEVGLLKPDPAIYQLSLERLGVGAETAVFIDDLAENTAAAEATGMAAIHHQTWTHTKSALAAWLKSEAAQPQSPAKPGRQSL